MSSHQFDYTCDGDGPSTDMTITVEYLVHDALPAARDPGGNLVEPGSPAFVEILDVRQSIGGSEPQTIPDGPLRDGLFALLGPEIESNALADQVAA